MGWLARGLSVAEACVSAGKSVHHSRASGLRYVQEAQSLTVPVPLTELRGGDVQVGAEPGEWRAGAAAADRTTISETVARALSAYLAGHGGHGA